MNKKLFGVILVTLMMIATGITVAQTLKLETNNSEQEKGATDWGWYNPAGAWKRYDNELFLTVSPAGWGRYSIVCEGKTIVPTWYGMFPTAVDLSSMFGEIVVTGKNTYDITLIDYAIDENYDIVYFRLWNGAMEQTSQDTMTATFTASIYGPGQDPFGDEDPEYGCWGPWAGFTYDRIPVVPPCEP
jgi:hypothetical protein